MALFHPFVLDNAAGQETIVGIGSDHDKYGVGISSNVHITGVLTAFGGIRDSNGNIGDSGKVLSSTGIGISWINTSEQTLQVQVTLEQMMQVLQTLLTILHLSVRLLVIILFVLILLLHIILAQTL